MADNAIPVLSKDSLLNLGYVTFDNDLSSGVPLLFPASGECPRIDGTSMAFGNYDSTGYSFADLPSGAEYGGMVMSIPSYYRSLPTATPSSAAQHVSGGGYTVFHFGSWAMIGGYIGFSEISSGSTEDYTFKFTDLGGASFKNAPSICIQEQNGFGAWDTTSNYTNTTNASCSYGNGTLSVTITRYVKEAGSLVFFISGIVQ